MTTAIAINPLEREIQHQEYIKQGRIVESMEEFYHDDAVMQENVSAPTVGRAANTEREKQFLAAVREWKGYEVKSIAADGDTTFVEVAMEFVLTDGTPVRMEQVSVARWRDGKIAHERFYYDPKK